MGVTAGVVEQWRCGRRGGGGRGGADWSADSGVGPCETSGWGDGQGRSEAGGGGGVSGCLCAAMKTRSYVRLCERTVEAGDRGASTVHRGMGHRGRLLLSSDSEAELRREAARHLSPAPRHLPSTPVPFRATRPLPRGTAGVPPASRRGCGPTRVDGGQTASWGAQPETSPSQRLVREDGMEQGRRS